MTIRFRWLPVLLTLLACPLPSARAATDAPPFGEVFELVRTNLPSLDAAKLNEMAVEGLLQRLGGLAQYAEVPLTNEPSADLLPVATAYEGAYGYVRIGEVSGGVAARLGAALAKAATTNQLKGLVLDLRFAGGRDFATAAQVADLFLAGGQKVLDWGEGPFISTTKTNAFNQPLAVLVNHLTRGSAEALAASLRHAGSALILGNTTAGEASLYREFTLSNGRPIRLAVTPVQTGDGETIPGSGVVPDIAVTVRPELERSY
ncbi:MAG TPA: S41 family peptidase, partial [Candidatus Limnocylindria bacterium]|nr:S41 family peptidase [Candidatus Limnocylindria bacterium]